jgi:hypothetical protein
MSGEAASDLNSPSGLVFDSLYFTGPTVAGDTACAAVGVRADVG